MSKRQRKVVLRNLECCFWRRGENYRWTPELNPHMVSHSGFEAKPYRWFGKPARVCHPSAPL